MISTLFRNTQGWGFQVILKGPIQPSFGPYEWRPLEASLYASKFPTGSCPLALLLIYPNHSSTAFCFSPHCPGQPPQHLTNLAPGFSLLKNHIGPNWDYCYISFTLTLSPPPSFFYCSKKKNWNGKKEKVRLIFLPLWGIEVGNVNMDEWVR